jgi:hypothetical protein
MKITYQTGLLMKNKINLEALRRERGAHGPSRGEPLNGSKENADLRHPYIAI